MSFVFFFPPSISCVIFGGSEKSKNLFSLKCEKLPPGVARPGGGGGEGILQSKLHSVSFPEEAGRHYSKF